MKKFIQIIDKSSKDSSHTHHVGNFIGKTFVVGKQTVTVEDTIAEGGFALVFLVKASNGVRYALKRMYVNKDEDLSVAKNEINIMKLLSGHPTIVGYVDSSIVHTGKGVYEVLLLMNYIKKDLLHFMNEKFSTGLSENEILKIFGDICDAVGRLHQVSTPIIHRDLKIENILIDNDNNYVLCDFGSATQQELRGTIENMADVEEEIQRYTTMAYRSPEMVDLYLDKSINHKADIWAMGCLLYKLCFFKLPFEESPLAITSGNFSIPENKYSIHLHNLIRYMLEPDPDLRPDIFQVATVVSALSNSECRVRNVNGTIGPTLNQLMLIIKERDQHVGIKINCVTSAPVIEGTSVAPRQRPKGSQAGSALGKGLPLPLPAHGRVPTVSPEVPIQTEERHVEQAVSPAVKEVASDTAAASAFPPSDLFGATFPFRSDSSPDQKGPVETENLFPPSGYPDPFQSSAEGPSEFPVSPSHKTFPVAARIESPEDVLPKQIAKITNLSPEESFTPGHRRNVSDSSAYMDVYSKPDFGDSHVEQQQETPSEALDNKLPENNVCEKKPGWNPFNDKGTFAQLSEDHLFGAEFDKIRQTSQNSESPKKLSKDDDPFDAAPFSQGRSSKLSTKSKSSSRASRSGQVASTSPSPIVSGDDFISEPTPLLQVHDEDKKVEEKSFLEFVHPPLEDRSKYAKLQNSKEDESDDEHTKVLAPKPPLPIKYLSRKKITPIENKTTNTSCQAPNEPRHYESDDSIGSASDLKERMHEDCDYFYCDQGTIATVGSSVYQAECESVTTYEEDQNDGQSGQRGLRPNRAIIRAKADETKGQKAKATGDRLLGHEYGEKPLLLDDELDSDGDERQKSKGRPNSIEDVFGLAPFKRTTKLKLAHKSNNSSDLSIQITSDIVTPPSEFNSPTSESTVSQNLNVQVKSPSEEYPIYENVTLNEGPHLSDVRDDLSSAAKNPFLNPFLVDSDYEKVESANLPSTAKSQKLSKMDDTKRPIDIFGCTPFSGVSYRHDNVKSPEKHINFSSPLKDLSTTVDNIDCTDEDLFGSIPFQPIRNVQQSTPAKSRTLPASMSSILKAQITEMSKNEDNTFKMPKIRKSTPPGFRKPRQAHQVLSDSESSENDNLMLSKKQKNRDRSKDRLKYKNIGDEFEEDNLMVLPTKNFALSKKDREKLAKKSKKLEKTDKKQEKIDKKVDKSDKKDKNSNAGISNMSFEDFSVDENKTISKKSEDETGDLRLTGGNRFGSLKRGISAISKLGR